VPGQPRAYRLDSEPLLVVIDGRDHHAKRRLSLIDPLRIRRRSWRHAFVRCDDHRKFVRSMIRLGGCACWPIAGSSTTHLPLTYLFDAQQIGPDTYVVAEYTKPCGIVEFDRAGHILWEYRIPSGPGMLDHPSLAEVLPSGVICFNDDYRHRVVLIDPKTKTIVWQYGVDDISGTVLGPLNTPDGFDLLAPNGTTPTQRWTG